MIDETKKCRMCKSEIAVDAKKCPYCRSFQNWLSRLFVLVAVPMLLCIFVMLLLTMMITSILDEGEPCEGELFKNYKEALVISESELIFGGKKDDPTVVVVGSIQNRSDVNWNRIYLQVNCYNSEDKLFDTEQDSDYSLLVPAGTTIQFKVSFEREFPEAEYVRHEVMAVHAKDEKDWSF